MRYLGRHPQFTFSPCSLQLVAPYSYYVFVFASHSLAIALPRQSQRDTSVSAAPSHDILPRADAEITAPSLIADLTLSTGLSIGCIFAAYAGALVLVGAAIAALSRTRKRALSDGVEEAKTAAVAAKLAREKAAAAVLRSPILSPPAHGRNFLLPSPRSNPNFPLFPADALARAHQTLAHGSHPSQSSICLTPTSDPFAEVAQVMDSRMQARDQLADLYKLVLQQDEERAESQANSPQNSHPDSPAESAHHHSGIPRSSETHRDQPPPPKRDKAKPTTLSLGKDNNTEKRKSRGGALLLALLSPKRKSKGLSISSPLMTPMSAQMAHHDTQEMHPLSPRHYIPIPPPPVPTGAAGLGVEPSPPGSPRERPRLVPRASRTSLRYQEQCRAEEREQTQGQHQEQEQGQDEEEWEQQKPTSIEGRLATLALPETRASSSMHGRRPADIDISPISVTSQSSQTPLIGLPSSPKPSSVRVSGLPQSPKPGATFQTQVPTPRSHTAVRANGALALRAYEPSGDAVMSLQFRQTVFERTGMLSPASPGTAVPYTPYQPFTPCVPMTPSLVTKEDRRRMKKMEPKTPTVEMVKSSEEVW